MDQFERLFDAYAENALTESERQELNAWLRDDGANVTRFVRESFLHWQLYSVARQQQMQASVMATRVGGEADPWQSSSRAMAPRRRRIASLNVAASCVALMAVATCLYWALRPGTAAQLTKATADATWEGSSASISVGSLLRTGQSLHLVRGRAMATLVNGAQLILDGPAQIRIEDENTIWIESGRLGGAVPPQASGLVIRCPFAQFVDLGTEFTIDVQPATGCSIHVFDGMVEIRPATSSDQPMMISEGSAVRYNAANDEIDFLPFDEGQKLSL